MSFDKSDSTSTKINDPQGNSSLLWILKLEKYHKNIHIKQLIHINIHVLIEKNDFTSQIVTTLERINFIWKHFQSLMEKNEII